MYYDGKIVADFAPEIPGMERGMVFCMSNAGDRNLLIRIPYEGESVLNLSEAPLTDTIH